MDTEFEDTTDSAREPGDRAFVGNGQPEGDEGATVTAGETAVDGGKWVQDELVASKQKGAGV